MKEITLSRALYDRDQLRERWLEAVNKCKYNPKYLRVANLYWARLKCYRNLIEKHIIKYAGYSTAWKQMVGYDGWQN